MPKRQTVPFLIRTPLLHTHLDRGISKGGGLHKISFRIFVVVGFRVS